MTENTVSEEMQRAIEAAMDKHLEGIRSAIDGLRIDVDTKRAKYEDGLSEVIKVSNRHNELTREVKDLFVRTSMATERRIMDARDRSADKHDQLVGMMQQFTGQQSALNTTINDLRSEVASSRVDIAEIKKTALTPEQVKGIVTDRVSVIGVGIATVAGLVITIVALVIT